MPAVDDDPGQQERYEAERQKIREAFGLKLALRRKERPRISQEALSRLAGLHRTEISALERGEREPRLHTLLLLARALGKEEKPGELLEGLPAAKAPKPKGKRKRAAGKPAVRAPRGGSKP